jgi:hypothetical protein
MEEASLTCPSCGKQNPENARFCYACGATLIADEPIAFTEPVQPAEDLEMKAAEADLHAPEAAYAQTRPQYVQHAAPVTPPPASPPVYSQQAFPPSKPRKRGRVRCCFVGCLFVLLVLLIGLPALHVFVLRPIIERAIYKQVHKNVVVEKGDYYGFYTETITERELNANAKDDWLYIPGASDGYLTLEQDQIKLEVKVYGVKVWAAADMRVNTSGELAVKSIKMHWLLHVLFSEDALKREITDVANEKFIQPNGLTLLAFQVTEGKIFIAYEGR